VLEKLPVPNPLVVLFPAIVGFAVVLQHTPLTVTAVPPSLVMLPPVAADVSVIEVTVVVVKTGTVIAVVENDTWLP
jgi:hypothetical protein